MFVLLSNPLVLRIESMVPWDSLPGARYVSQADRKGTHELEEGTVNGFKDFSGEEGENDELQGHGTVKLKEKIAEKRKLRAAAVSELEKERAAASSAADEAMAKIAMLQSQKGLIERQARLYREMAEQKQLYDEQVI
ncbi:hypothetical protein B296_00019485 [Ensete ventricosum]|uniref:GTD-binding domain-containing protein n=1 Tax=Ensete ventricosum TaxID=4639 RepID=A0A427AQB7_ENSVE|nr:hypothetical protein B296_00019485 [Ensete ventricosum]